VTASAAARSFTSTQSPVPGGGLFDTRSRTVEGLFNYIRLFFLGRGLRLIGHPHDVAVYVHLARMLHTMSGLGGLESWHVSWFDDESLIPIYK